MRTRRSHVRAAVTLAVLIAGCGRWERPADDPASESEPPPPPSAPVATQPPSEPVHAAADAGRGATESTPDDDDALLAELDAENDDEGIREIPRCLSLRGAAGCTGVGKVMLACTGLGNILQEAPTERLLGCLEARNDTDALCATDVLETCALAAIDETPPTDLSSRTCRELVTRCPVEPRYAKYFTEKRCAAGLAALRKPPRDDFVACMQKRCDLRLCASALL